MRFFLLTFLVVSSLVCQSGFAVETKNVDVQLDVQKWTLPNGLTVLFHEDHSVPVVSYQQWFRVGSKDEVVGQTGLAHFFEHLMFKGSKNFPAETFSRVLNSKGGNFNAFTSNDYTGYYINAPSDQLSYLIQVEADRMRNLLIDEKEIQTEREVVKEERRVRYDNSPDGFMWVTLPEMMYSKLPYRWPVIGSMEDLNKATLQDFKNFYNRFYAPNNAVIVVAGDFNAAKVKKQITSSYGGFAAQDLTRPKYESEAEQKAARSKTIKWKVQNPILTIAYPTVTSDHQDNFALEILGAILGDGDSSRLHQKMVYQDQQAISVNAYNYPQSLAGRFIVSSNLKETTKPSVAQNMIQNQIQVLINKGVTTQELQKAKNGILTEQVTQLKKVGERARSLAYHEIVFGDYKRLFTDLDKYMNVTNEDVVRVAKTYLTPKRANIVIVQPE